MFHLFESYQNNPAKQWINHGYLAVDFFFLLSGYVIGYAYDDRRPALSLREFCMRRLIRLQPMVIVGSVIGAALFYFQASPEFSLVAGTPPRQVVLLMILGAAMIPVTPALDIRGKFFITHYPLIYIYAAWVLRQHPSLSSGVLLGILTLALSVLIAYLALKLYDLPVRRRLSRRLLTNQ